LIQLKKVRQAVKQSPITMHEFQSQSHFSQSQSKTLFSHCGTCVQLTFNNTAHNPEWFTFLMPAYPGCPGKKAVKWM